jgi:hypothetical protein
MSAETLLPCPFCGEKARTFDYNGSAHVTCAREFEHCAGTDVVAPVAMWNLRTPPAPMEAVACQKCGGEVQGWTCQGCEQGFRENDGGALIFAAHPPQPEAPGWRHIATAPRGAKVLISDPQWGVTEGLLMDGGRWGLATFNGQIMTANPTHWQPLPPPPSA